MKTNVSPRPADLLEAWLLEYLVKQFKKVDILTVSDLATYVKANGPLWYKDV
ncbi:phage integrase family protein, partial [Acinetobacter baumannii]